MNRKWTVATLLLVALSALAPSAWAQTSYDASLNTLPEAQGWTYANNHGNPAPSVSNGILFENTPFGEQYWTKFDSSIDFSQSLVLEARLHIISSNYIANVGTGTREGYYLGISEGLRSYSLGLASTGFNINTIQVPNDPLTAYPVPITDGFHVFRIEITGGLASFSIDGTLIATNVTPMPCPCIGSPNSVIFGGVAGVSVSVSELKYIRLTPGCQVNPNVPLIKQNVGPWSPLLYDAGDDSGTATIGGFGCYLTSSVMLVNYYAAAQNSLFRTNPIDLDNYLLGQEDGYFPRLSGRLHGRTVARYARDVGGLQVYWYGPDEPDDSIVDNFLCNNDPVILNVPTQRGHFVVATGQTAVAGRSTFSINDPAYPRTTLADYDFKYLGIRKFSSQSTPLHGLVITGHSPIELLLIDPDGNRTGFDPTTGGVVLQIPASSYTAESISDDVSPNSGTATPEIKTLEVITPSSGSYVVQVTGTGVGSYTLSFLGYDVAEHLTTQSITGSIIPGLTVRFGVTYSSEVGAQVQVTRRVTIGDILTAVQLATQQNLIDNAGVANSLSQKLRATQAALARADQQAANGVLGAFVNEVSAQTGQHIQTDAANLLSADANALLASLGLGR